MAKTSFFRHPPHRCDPRTNIKEYQSSDRTSVWTGKKSEATG
ncbi:hypothetical protein [Cylindrospermum sp. FACHB-282]|nr:hypothetical protein [Cylindrospermum sp. FACHB-282]